MITNIFLTDILSSLEDKKEENLISDFNFRIGFENELIFFFKPECFLLKDGIAPKNIFDLVLQKFTEFNANISGAVLLTGKRLEEIGAMDRHYGFINKLSKNASTIINNDEKNIIKDKLQIDSIKNIFFLGGHEFLKKFTDYDEEKLNDLWMTKKSHKIRSGFYFQHYIINNIDIILINGFHPMQLKHYTNDNQKIIVLLIHSNTDWNKLKFEMVGETYPEKASINSIRGHLFKNQEYFNLKDISVANNYVHLSAGPFEAFYEINNFLGDLISIDFDLSSTNMFRLMKNEKFSQDEIKKILLNPKINVGEKEEDLFTLTEDINSTLAISKLKRYKHVDKFIS